MRTSKRAQALSVVGAVAFVAIAMIAGYRSIGLPPVIIVGGSSVIALVMWTRTYLREPLDASVILPPFLLTVAALEIHMIEEYLARFGPAMSRLFDISWTERSFLMVFAFIVMIQADVPSIITVFSCVYVNVELDHTTGMPAARSWLYAGVLNDLHIVELSRIAWTSRPACFLATSAASTGLELIWYIVM